MNLFIKNSTNKWVLCTLILLLAGVFRLSFIQYVEFKSDEALNLFLASRPLFHHPFPPASLASSAGILNFPLINYVLFPIVLFTLFPPTISFVIALLNVATIGGFFLLFSKYHGRLTGFLASCFLCLSPWAILYSRKIWAQDFLLPFSLPFFFSMYKILEGKKHYWLLFGISSVLLMQIHQLAILLPIIVFCFLVAKRIKPDWKNLFLGIGIGLLPAIPYFLYQTQFFCLSCRVGISVITRFSYHNFSTFLRPLQILSIGNFHTELGNDFALFSQTYHWQFLFSKISYVAYLLTPLGAILFWRKEKQYGFFPLLCLCFVLLLFLLGIEPLMHYYILLLPFLALFIGYFLSFLLQQKQFRLIGILITVLYIFSLFIFNYSVLSLLIKKGGFSGDFGGSFTSGRAEILKSLEKYQASPDYQEIILAKYVGSDWLKGYMPVGKMLFPHDQLNKHIAGISKQFEKDPHNPLIAMQVVAYYTKDEYPTWQYVLQMWKLADEKKVYAPIYQDILDRYLIQHYKHLYETPDFLLLYPEHWEKNIDNKAIALLSDSAIFTITSSPEIIPRPVNFSTLYSNPKEMTIGSIPTIEFFCIQKNNWCGTWFDPVQIGGKFYLFSLSPINQLKGTFDVEYDSERIAQEIFSSIEDITK